MRIVQGFSILILVITMACADKEPVLKWEMQELDSKASIRGISVVDENIAWLSGSNGTIARTTDGGQTWEKIFAPIDSLDYRDIEAFNADEAIILSIGTGDPSKVFKTMNGGTTWEQVDQNTYEEGFYTGIAFWDKNHGFLVGDPVEGHNFVLVTDDGGQNWSRIDTSAMPPLLETEYGFAASGTHLTVFGEDRAWIGTGGVNSRVFYSNDKGRTWEVSETPIIQGEPSTGIFSLEFRSPEYGVAVGGDYTKEEEGENNVMITEDGGKTWKLSTVSQVDYRSCVRFVEDLVIATGPSGSDYSLDGGNTWKGFGDQGFHTMSVGKDGLNSVWAAGSGGRVAKLIVE